MKLLKLLLTVIVKHPVYQRFKLSESSIKSIAICPPKDFLKSGRSDVERGVSSVCNQAVPPFMCPLH